MKFFKGLVGKAWANGPHVITANLNQPIKLNLTNMEEKICDNLVINNPDDITTTVTNDVDNSPTNKILNKPDLKFVANAITWQQMSPKKEKKNSSSGSSDCSSSGESQGSGLKTWASIKKTSIENMELKSNSGQSSSSTSSSSGSNTSPTRTWSSIKQETNKNNSLNRKDGSPTKRCLSCDSQENVIIQTADDTKANENSGLDNFSFSSKGSPTHAEKRTIHKAESNDCENSSTSLPSGNSQEDGIGNDYFYDEDFTVQFDTNLRESTPALNLGPEQPEDVEFPNMVTGSYLSFKNTKSSGIMHSAHNLFCADESEISVSHHSNMEVSSSEREMMCSSDMLEFSDNPLFTPPLSGDVQMVSQEDSTDSLDKIAKEKARMDLNGSETSSDGNLNLDCFPRKEEYFLSFDGSAGHTESYSEQSNSINSNCSSQGQNNQINICSNEDVGDESSESFHICMAGNNFHKKPVGSRLAKFQTLTALQEQTSELSGSSEYSDEKPCSEPVSSPTKRTFRRLSPTKGRQFKVGQKICFACHLNNSCGESHSSPTRSRSRQKSVTSWKQVKSLKKLGKLDNILDPSRSRSMPDIRLQTWQSGSSLTCHGHDVQRIAESFHCRRHSAYLLDLYQRVRNQSNPVSPECMANIEQILFHNVICKESKIGASAHCDFCRDGSHSTNTLTGSHQVFKDGKLGYYTHKRILDWLDKEKVDNKVNKSCQTESLIKNKDTLVSPTTVTLWCGTKNFGNQFPPCATDCGIQTNVHELDDNTKEYAQQTTPTLEGRPEIPKSKIRKDTFSAPSKPSELDDSNLVDKNDILKLISHDFKEVENILPTNDLGKAKGHHIPRSKSADSARRQNSNTLRKTLFYSHKSLPDLSFVDYKHIDDKHDDGTFISLFDPLPVAMPVPVFIPTVVDSEKVTKSLSTKLSTENITHCCRSSSRSRSKGHRSHSAPARSHAVNCSRHCAESGSSSSGFTSSTSSGIDPGYSTDRGANNSSPSTDIERLIFYPPHVENTYKGDYLSENLSDSGNISIPSNPDRSRSQNKPKSSDKKVSRYTNEMHPGNLDQKQKIKPARSPGNNSSHSSNGSLHLERLYALQEENTPVSSPERDLCHHESDYLYGNAYCVNCYKGRDQGQGHIEGWEDEEVVVRRRKFDYHIQLSSESGSSGSGSFFPNFDKKPLKSCLRKRQFLRTRSLSDPFDLGQQEQQIKSVQKKNRHSYACEEIILLQDESGEYFVCKSQEEDAQPVVLYIEEKHSDDQDKTIVKMRPKTQEKETEVEAEKELNGKRKSVSFASEVSFHAISPHMSPKRQQTSVEEVKPVDTEVVQTPKQDHTGSHGSDKQSSDSDESMPPTDFQVSPTRETIPEGVVGEITPSSDQKKQLLSAVICAAESLVEHFASAKNPFDKLRLGSSADTPEIGDLVLSRLCPAIHRLIDDGLKPHLTGVQVFGRVQVTSWKLAEASVEQGPYTRAIHDLVQQLKGHTGLVSHSNKFDAFVFGLLNLRLLDYWLGYLRHNNAIVEKFYNPDSVMSLSGTLYERQYSEILISLQPLAVLPFQLSIDYICSSQETVQTTSNTEEGSPKRDNSVPKKDNSLTKKDYSVTKKDNSVDHCMTDSFSKEKAIIGVAASKAWDWLKNGASVKSPSDELPSPPIITGNVMISSITGILSKLSGKADPEKTKHAEDTTEQKEGERPIISGGLTNVQIEDPPAKPPRVALKLNLLNNKSSTETSSDDSERTGCYSKGDNSGAESVDMLSSFNGMAQKLLGIKTDKVEKTENKTTDNKTQSMKKGDQTEENKKSDTQTLVVKREKKEDNDFDAEKTKSGLIRLFDKLLLPRDSSKKEQKLKSRWSWGYGQGQQVKPVSLATKPQAIKTDLKSPTQSKLPSYIHQKGSVSQSKGATAALPMKPLSRPVGKSPKGEATPSKVDKQKDSATKLSRDRPQVKSKVPVRKATSVKSSKGSNSKSSEGKSENVPKSNDNKWQGGITLSASLEEGPTLKAPPSITHKVITDSVSEAIEEEKSEQEVPKEDKCVDKCNIVSMETYQDAKTSSSTENTLHLSDELNCNSPPYSSPHEGDQSTLTGDQSYSTQDQSKLAETGFRKPTFRFVSTIKDSDQSEGDFSYSAGDHFEVLAQLDSDWLYCINGKKEGLIRLENVQPITDEEEFKKLHDDFYS